MKAKLLFFLICGLLITGCAGQVASEPEPPVIHYGEDICEFCGMIISDERFAAGYVTHEGKERIFDDLGGMFRSYLEMQEDVMAFFVHDYEEITWIRAEHAFYVLSQDLPTPMLNGLAACQDQDKAEALAAQYDGQILTFDEVLAFYQSDMNIKMADDHSEHHH
ncbi:MAG: nitrous oxide reductase accessory protein NosL [Anaerolineae bacterium]|nr:nitrous oxide reductase accessory protein NosL [Anaerolineae bacterium]